MTVPVTGGGLVLMVPDTTPPPAPASAPLELFTAPRSSGTTEVTMRPSSNLAAGTERLALLMPFPRGFLDSVNNVALLDANDNEIACDVVLNMLWHIGTDASETSIRSVAIIFDRAVDGGVSEVLKVRWGTPRTLNLGSGVTDPETLHQVKPGPEPGENSRTDNYPAGAIANEDLENYTLAEQKAFFDRDPVWLSECNIVDKSLPRTDFDEPNWTGLDTITGAYDHDDVWQETVKTYVNDVADTVADNTVFLTTLVDRFEMWLYDRPRLFANAYMQYGSAKYERHFYRAQRIYSHLTKPDGRWRTPSGFSDSTRKYNLGAGSAMAQILFGGNWVGASLDRMVAPGNAMDDIVPDMRSVQPEPDRQSRNSRTLASILDVYTARYMLDGDATAKAEVESFIDFLYTEAFAPTYAATQNLGVIQHTLSNNDHGTFSGMGSERDTIFGVDGWKSVLLLAALWRYYLVWHDTRALELLSRYGDFFANHPLGTDAQGSGGTPAFGEHLGVNGVNYDQYSTTSSPENVARFRSHHNPEYIWMLRRAILAKRLLDRPQSEVDSINAKIGDLNGGLWIGARRTVNKQIATGHGLRSDGPPTSPIWHENAAGRNQNWAINDQISSKFAELVQGTISLPLITQMIPDVVEGAAATLTLTIPQAVHWPVAFNFELLDTGTAQPGVDFDDSVAGRYSFPHHGTLLQIQVPTIARAGVQGNRVVDYRISDISGARSA